MQTGFMSNIGISKTHYRQPETGIYRWLLILIAGLLLSACGGRVGGVYVDSRETSPLQVPANLDKPSTEAALTIPGSAAPQLAGLRDEAVPPKVLTSEEAAQSTSRVGFGDGALFLLVDDRVESVYRRLGFTLNRGEMSINERDPNNHSYLFTYRQPAPAKVKKSFWRKLTFWRGNKGVDYSGRYEIRLVADDDDPEHTRIYLYDGDGVAARPEPVEQLLGLVQERLG